MAYYREESSPKYRKEVTTVSLPLSQELSKIKNKMEDSNNEQHFKRTPKVLTNVENAKPVERVKKVHELCNAQEYEITRVGDKYVIKQVGKENSEELAFALYKSFAQSDFMVKFDEMMEAQQAYFDAAKKHSPNKNELLKTAQRIESEMRQLRANLVTYVQKEIF